MKSISDSNVPLISNNFVKCYSDYFVIDLYYFPYGNKKVYYNNIRSCDLHTTDNMGLFDFKHWGMALSPIWWHCDIKRLGRKYFILIDANQWPKIGLTMDDNDIINVWNFIRQKIFSNQSNIYQEKLPHYPNSTISEKEPEEKLPYYPNSAILEKEREHQESMKRNKTN